MSAGILAATGSGAGVICLVAAFWFWGARCRRRLADLIGGPRVAGTLAHHVVHVMLLTAAVLGPGLAEQTIPVLGCAAAVMVAIGARREVHRLWRLAEAVGFAGVALAAWGFPVTAIWLPAVAAGWLFNCNIMLLLKEIRSARDDLQLWRAHRQRQLATAHNHAADPLGRDKDRLAG